MGESTNGRGAVAPVPAGANVARDVIGAARVTLGRLAIPLALLVLQLVAFGMPAGAWIRGVVIGLLTALLAIGMALVYRANRVLNFAQADLGFVPTTLVIGLVAFSGWPYFAAMGLGVVAALALGVVVEMAVIRRFSRSPRLVLTVATLGLGQLLLFFAVLVPRMWDEQITSVVIDPPMDWQWEVGTFVLNASDLLSLVIAPLAMIGVALFLGRTRIGVAVRAAAERGDRASMLGIPVPWLSTIVWSLAAGLSFLALFLRADVLSIPLGSALSLTTLVQALAALVIGRLRHLPTVAFTAVALGVLDYGVQWNASSPLLVQPIIGAAVLVALLLQRRSVSRLDDDTSASWNATEQVRPLTDSQAGLLPVRLLRWGLSAVVVLGLVAVPVFLRVDQVYKATGVAIFAIVGVSLVVLTGWAGQISLGQMAFVGIGAAVAGKCTLDWGLHIVLALLAGGAAGALTALVVGLPALRLRGLYLAVTTLAFAMTVSAWILNDTFPIDWVPRGRVTRGTLLSTDALTIDLMDDTTYYVFCLAVLGLVALGVRGIRRSRTGRAIIALRENERAAQSYSLSAVRVKLTAFVISGTIAGIAGGLFVHYSFGIDLASYQPDDSITVFIAAVVGGLGSTLGAVLGAVYLKGGEWFITDADWRVLTSGAGVLFVLLVLPGGLGGLVSTQRERFVRWAEARHPGSAPSSDDASVASSAATPSAAADSGAGDPEADEPAPEDVLA